MALILPSTSPITANVVSNRMLSKGFVESISAGNPLQGFFNGLPQNILFREAMEQVLSAKIPETQNDTLRVSINLAMDDPAAAGMTVDEMAAIKMYTMPVEPPTTALYYLLNKALREKNRDNIKPFVKILWLLMHALKKAPPCRSLVVYRGVKENLSGQYIKGQKITWQGFTSTTTSLDVLSQDLFLGTTGQRTMFNIELTTGRARMISELSMLSGENEVLLPPSSRFEVNSVLKPTTDGLLIFHLREIVPIDPILTF
eukprot:gene603-biopygen289